MPVKASNEVTQEVYPKLYPFARKFKGRSFKNSKIHTVPSQSMSLKEIIQRFIRRESLPVSKDAVYSTKIGDIEKLSRADITEQMERVQEIAANIEKGQKRARKQKEDEAAAQKAAEEALKQRDPLQPPTPSGT